jgi:hypothetical protein
MLLLGDEAQQEARFSLFRDSANLDARSVHSLRPMVLLSDEAQLEARFGSLGASANFDAIQVHSLRRKYHRLENCFGRIRRNSSMMWIL